ncbi:MAG: putative quinol monooxygenase [Actinomycetota bacterium]
MGEPFALVVRFTLKEGAGSAFDQLTADTLAGIRAHEPDTLLYATSRVPDDPSGRIFFEVYRDREAFDYHEAQTHTRRFLGERERFVERFEVTFLSVAAAKGISGIEA